MGADQFSEMNARRSRAGDLREVTVRAGVPAGGKKQRGDDNLAVCERGGGEDIGQKWSVGPFHRGRRKRNDLSTEQTANLR